jgi:hypothetical protein
MDFVKQKFPIFEKNFHVVLFGSNSYRAIRTVWHEFYQGMLMAITYVGAGGLFTDLGCVIAQVNDVALDLEDWNDRLDLIQSVLADNQDVALEPAIGIVDSIKSSLSGTRASLSAICDLRLTDYDTIVSQLLISSTDIVSVLDAMIYRMRTDSEYIRGSVVTIGSVTAASSNIGNGTVLVTKILDGYSSPASNFQPHPEYLNLNSEVSVDETIRVLVNGDSYSERTTAGQESLSINGLPSENEKWGVGVEGSGDGPSISTTQAGGILENSSFELFSTTNTPDSWTIVTGTVTTNIASEAAIVYAGSYALKLIGTGAAASISVSQAVAEAVSPLRGYCCTFRYRASAAEGVAGKTFTVSLSGTGYTAGASEKVTMDGTALPTSYTLGSFFVNLPSVVPSDLAMVISFTGTPTVTLYIDDFGFTPVTWHNGVGIAVVAGSTNFVNGDYFTFTVDNNKAGTFQEYFRRNYEVQLPSKTDGTETISDTLCQ